MIPKIIHYCWFGHGKIPEKNQKCIESWKKYCPEYKIVRWDETNYDIKKNQYMYEAYKAKKWSFVSDYARLDIIYENGGVYFDTDVELIRNIDDLLNNSAFMGFENSKAVASGLGIGAEKHAPIIGEMLHSIYDKIRFLREDGSYDTKPVPLRTIPFLEEKGLQPNGELQELSCGLTIYPQEYFCPMDYVTGILHITDKTYSIHHFHASWCTEEEKKAHVFSQKIAKKFGKRPAYVFGYLYMLPYNFKLRLKQYGLARTIKYVIKKIGIRILQMK